MNGDYETDLQEVLRAVDYAEVFVIFFPLLRKSLVIDTRSDMENPPLVRLMPQVGSPQERYRVIRRLRPHFPRLEQMPTIPWHKLVRSLFTMGVVDRIRSRLAQSGGGQEAIAALDEATSELLRLERLELASVIQGDNDHTIWPRER